MAGARFDSASELASLALAFLLATTAVAFNRALILESALSVIGGIERRWLGAWSGALFAGGFGLLAAAVAFITGLASDLHGLLVVCLSAFAACFQDHLRYRALHGGRANRALLSDAVWVAAAVGGTFLVPVAWEPVLLVWALGAAMGVLALIYVDRRPAHPGLLREVLLRGRFQVGETALTALLGVVPMVIGIALGWDARIAALRLVQSAVGPLNAVHSALALSVLVRSQELVSRSAGEVATLHSRLRGLTSLAALAYVLPASAILLVFPLGAPAVASNMPVAVVVTCSAILLTSISSPAIVLLRAHGRQDWVLYARAAIVGVAALVSTCLVLTLPDVVDPVTAVVFSSAAIGAVVWQVLFTRLLRDSKSRYQP